MSHDKKVKEHLIARMKQCELYANYWMHSATNGTGLYRTIYHDGVKMTPDELRQNAMDTALTHIQNFNEAMDDLMELDDKAFS
jgi:hypothetical protein